MKNFDASNEMVEAVNCAVCEKEIRGANWFARISKEEHMVALCCPLCEEVFVKKPKPYIGRIVTYERAG